MLGVKMKNLCFMLFSVINFLVIFYLFVNILVFTNIEFNWYFPYFILANFIIIALPFILTYISINKMHLWIRQIYKNIIIVIGVFFLFCTSLMFTTFFQDFIYVNAYLIHIVIYFCIVTLMIKKVGYEK